MLVAQASTFGTLRSGAKTMVSGKRIGVLTAGGDSPGLNAAIRGIGKAAVGHHGMEVIGFRDGFRGLVEDRSVRLNRRLSGILTAGGTILATSLTACSSTARSWI
jgi:6-phosphofructokinase